MNSKRKCVICRTRYARPNGFITCEELQCYTDYHRYLQQKYRLKTPENAQKVLDETKDVARKLNNLLRQRAAASHFIKVHDRLARRL